MSEETQAAKVKRILSQLTPEDAFELFCYDDDNPQGLWEALGKIAKEHYPDQFDEEVKVTLGNTRHPAKVLPKLRKRRIYHGSQE